MLCMIVADVKSLTVYYLFAREAVADCVKSKTAVGECDTFGIDCYLNSCNYDKPSCW